LIKKKRIFSTLFLALLVSGCQSTVSDTLGQSTANLSFDSKLIIKGKAEFPVPALKVNNAFNINAVLSDIANQATISVIYPHDHPIMPNATVATGLTTANGSFTINPGSDFNPEFGDIFIVEAAKRIGGGGKDSLSISTLIRWDGTGWSSITFPGVVINSKTTALALIAEYRKVNSATIINKIQITGNGTSTVPDIGSEIKAVEINKVSEQVNYALANNRDPLDYISYEKDLDNFKIKVPIISNPLTISTVAGATDENIPATSVTLNLPLGITADNQGNFIFADSANNIIRKVDSNGLITTLAGNGTAGFSGDNGPATLAKINNPADIFLDSTGNLYIADTNNNRIRKVDNNGVISTVAGNGTASYSGDSGKATSAGLNGPRSIVVNSSGNLYIADTINNKLRIVNSSGNISTATRVICTTPQSLAIDKDNNIYIADSGGNSVKKLLASGTYVLLIGPASGNCGVPFSINLNLQYPSSIDVDKNNNIYIDETNNNRIVKVTSAGTVSISAGGNNFSYLDGIQATYAKLNSPQGIAVDDTGQLYISDTNARKIRKVNINGIINTAGGTDSQTEQIYAFTKLFSPGGIAFDFFGNLFFIESGKNKVRTLSSQNYINNVGGTGEAGYSGDNDSATLAKFNNPSGIMLDNNGGIFIADTGNHRIRKIYQGSVYTIAGNGTPGFSGDGGSPATAQLNNPSGIISAIVNNSTYYYIADSGNNRIRMIGSGGFISTVAGGGNNISGTVASTVSLNNPSGIAFSNKFLYISDTGNNMIRKVDSKGNMYKIAGTGIAGYSGDNGPAREAQLSNPGELKIDSNGNIFFVDKGNHCIRKIDSNGNIFTVGGNGSMGFSGDQGLAIKAQLNNPSAIAISNNSIYISDSGNSRIRKLVE
jgi:sugar lactone lactonase YvrE